MPRLKFRMIKKIQKFESNQKSNDMNKSCGIKKVLQALQVLPSNREPLVHKSSAVPRH